MARMGRRCGERNVDAHRGYRRAAGRSGQLAGTLLLTLWDGVPRVLRAHVVPT